MKPTSIVLACADDGTGLENLQWTSWTAATATANGQLWEKNCTPSCAMNGTISTYPVSSITLSNVTSTSSGPVFVMVTVVFPGNGPGPAGKHIEQFPIPPTP